MIGITGNIACGKSTVLRMLAELGADTVDADRLYHELIAPGMPLAKAIGARFGEKAVDADGRIDRGALAKIVFADPGLLAELDALTHPPVAAAARERIGRSNSAVVALDAVKLIESGLHRDCDQVWLVECAPGVQRERLMARNGLSGEEAERRIAAQPPLEPKRAIAGLIIDNSGDPVRTRRQVEQAWSRLPLLSS